MSLSLRPMPDEAIAKFIVVEHEHYIDERITAGESPEEARKVADSQVTVLFLTGCLRWDTFFTKCLMPKELSSVACGLDHP